MIGFNSFLHSADYLYKPEKDLMHLFWSGVARRIAINFLAIFSAIYIYQLFLSLGYNDKTSIYFVLLFFSLIVIFKQAFFAISENLSQRVGFRGIIVFSLIPFAFLILSLVLSSNNPLLVFIAGALWGVHAGMFWWGHHGYFVKAADRGHFGAGLGEVEMLKTVASIIAPLTGALIIDFIGYNSIFIFSGIFMVISVLLLKDSGDFKQKHDVSYLDVLKIVLKHKSISLAYIFGGAEAIYYTVGWGLFLFLFFGDVLGLGAVLSISLLLSAIFGVFVGGKIDEQGERRVVTIGSPLFSIAWLLRAVSKTPALFVLADSLRHFSDKLVGMPLLELTYKKGVEDYVGKAILFRGIATGIGSLIGIVIIFVVVYLGIGLRGGFYAIAVMSLLPLVAIIRKRL